MADSMIEKIIAEAKDEIEEYFPTSVESFKPLRYRHRWNCGGFLDCDRPNIGHFYLVEVSICFGTITIS